ncbi:flagellar biosynthetic protein FliP [Polaromonas sp. A23]|nr:flagellar biosynthetic protein FliP [Polaromonas sp. A23]
MSFFCGQKGLRIAVGAAFVLLFASTGAIAAIEIVPGISLDVISSKAGPGLATPLKILLGLTLLSLIPALLIAVTSFSRIIIVLSMLRHALGTQETPPNTVLMSLALFLTLFTMTPVLEEIDKTAWQPYQAGKFTEQQALTAGIDPLRQFMLRQTREQDLGLMVEIARAEIPTTISEVKLLHLIPAFMLSELRTAFQIGFVIFLPFLLIDLVVSSVLMALGMMMVPPMTVSLPLKILMFILIDGWGLLIRALVGSIN